MSVVQAVLSHPSRVRELKRCTLPPLDLICLSHPSRVRELKLDELRGVVGEGGVAPLPGA